MKILMLYLKQSVCNVCDSRTKTEVKEIVDKGEKYGKDI